MSQDRNQMSHGEEEGDQFDDQEAIQNQSQHQRNAGRQEQTSRSQKGTSRSQESEHQSSGKQSSGKTLHATGQGGKSSKKQPMKTSGHQSKSGS